jgi:hypothetical protein
LPGTDTETIVNVMSFRTVLLDTLRAFEPVLRQPGVLVAGSEVPNLLEPEARSSLVVSKDLDLAVPVECHRAVVQSLREVQGFVPSKEEPSVWLPLREGFIEVNFIGLDRERPGDTYVLEDSELPLLVFGHLSLLNQGDFVEVDGLRIPLPRPAGLLLEKLLTDRSGEKGDRDLLVALGLILTSTGSDIAELVQLNSALAPDLKHAVRANLTTLSLLQTREGMPDPLPYRALVAKLLSDLERS